MTERLFVTLEHMVDFGNDDGECEIESYSIGKYVLEVKFVGETDIYLIPYNNVKHIRITK